MRRSIPASCALVLFIAPALLAQALLAQAPLKPTAPGTSGDPIWQGVLRLDDGRTFVTDGGFAIDAALAKPATLPQRVLVSKLLVDQLSAPHKAEHRLAELTEATPGRTYRTPSGINVNATYVDYLRRILTPAEVRLRVTEINQPIQVILQGRAVGVLMPVRQ